MFFDVANLVELLTRREEEQKRERGALCCARIANGTWCLLDDGHTGDHAAPGVTEVMGPTQPSTMFDRRLRNR